MCSKPFILALAGTLCALPAWASTITVESVGNGATREAARAEALKEAIMQVSGVTLDSETLQKISSVQQMTDADQRTGITATQDQTVRERIKGSVTGFRVLDEGRNPDGTVSMRLSVSIEKYDIPGVENRRRSIAVDGFSADKPGRCFGRPISESDMVRSVTGALQTAFVSSRKFAVLDRHSSAYGDEKAFIENGGTRIEEKAKLGLTRGADYIVTGTVKNVSVGETKRELKLSGGVQIDRWAKADFTMNVMMFATREVQLASNVSVKLDGNLSGMNCAEILNRLSEKAASEMARKASISIYPPKVIALNGGKVSFNYGGDEIRIGETYNVYSEGEPIIDPYTKEPLGREETLIGQVKVAEVKQKYSVASWVGKPAQTIKIGDILRPAAPAKPKPKPAKKKTEDDEW